MPSIRLRSCILVSLPLMFLACLVFSPAASRAQVDRAREFETQYYRVWTDVDGELARDLCQRLDAMYEEYARRFIPFPTGQPRQEKFEVRIFALREDYARYTRDRLPNSGGIFMPSRKLLAVYLEGQSRDAIRRTLQHEAFHQFAHAVFGPNLPPWLNEGIAQVFEEAIWTGRGFMLGQVPPARLRQLQHDLRSGRLIDFRRMIEMTGSDWEQGMRDRATTSLQYNQAWAMAHYLIYATGPDGQPLHRMRVLNMLARCHMGASPRDAFVGAFSDNFAGFEQRFVEYARSLQPTLEATHVEHQMVLADMLIALAGKGQRFDSVEAFRKELQAKRHRMEYGRGHIRWTTAEDPSVYFTNARGRPMDERQMYFQPRPGAPLPDLICRALDGVQFHTRFHEVNGKIQHEILVVPR